MAASDSSPTPSPVSAAASLVQEHDADAPSTSQEESLVEDLNASSADVSLDSIATAGSGEEKHPKGKRKRTAAKDKAILEAAYQANAKPDKAARQAIVARVSLNEKEVQIWFQNRRQNDRRKSRPLSPQEVAALRYGGMAILSSDPISFHASQLSSEPVGPVVPSSDGPISAFHEIVAPASTPPALTSPHMLCSTEVRPEGTLPQQSPTMVPSQDTPTEPEPSAPQSSQGSDHGLATASSSFSSSGAFPSHRWSHGSSFSTPATLSRGRDDTMKLELFAPSSCPPSTTSSIPVLPLPKSGVRISLSLAGKAEVVSNEPSPPRLQPARPLSAGPDSLSHVRPRTLQRSQSAITGVTLPPISTLTSNLPIAPPRLLRGRSRDVHAWELCCDKEDVTDELTTQAEAESNGSATAAISLLRSSSGSVLAANGAKRNAQPYRPLQRGQAPAKKQKTGRSMSSVGRVGSIVEPEKKTAVESSIEKDISGKLKVSMLLSPSGDSDKENWSPDEDGNPSRVVRPRQAPPPSATGRGHNSRRGGRVLQDHEASSLFASSRANTAPALFHRKGGSSQQSLDIFEDEESPQRLAPPREADEVERFMRGEVSPSKRGDVDCVAGLLALSQGNWR